MELHVPIQDLALHIRVVVQQATLEPTVKYVRNHDDKNFLDQLKNFII